MKNKLLVISILLIIIIVVSYYWYNKYNSYSETYVNTTTNIYIYNIDYSEPDQPINPILNENSDLELLKMQCYVGQNYSSPDIIIYIGEGIKDIKGFFSHSTLIGLKGNILTVNFPESLIEIGEYEFKDYSNLANVNFQSKIWFIGPYAFRNTNLTTVKLPTRYIYDKRRYQYAPKDLHISEWSTAIPFLVHDVINSPGDVLKDKTVIVFNKTYYITSDLTKEVKEAIISVFGKEKIPNSEHNCRSTMRNTYCDYKYNAFTIDDYDTATGKLITTNDSNNYKINASNLYVKPVYDLWYYTQWKKAIKRQKDHENMLFNNKHVPDGGKLYSYKQNYRIVEGKDITVAMMQEIKNNKNANPAPFDEDVRIVKTDTLEPTIDNNTYSKENSNEITNIEEYIVNVESNLIANVSVNQGLFDMSFNGVGVLTQDYINYTFQGYENAYMISIGENVTTLGENLFKEHTSVNFIIISESVKFIEEGCFESCTNLEYVLFKPDSNLNSIKDRAFANCNKLKSIHLPDNLETIGSSVFEGCKPDLKVYIKPSSNLKNINASAFDNNRTSPLYLPSTTNFISDPNNSENILNISTNQVFELTNKYLTRSDTSVEYMGVRGGYDFSSANEAKAKCEEEGLQLCKKDEVIAGAKTKDALQNVCSAGWTEDAPRGWYSVKGSQGCGSDNTWNVWGPENGKGSAHCCNPVNNNTTYITYYNTMNNKAVVYDINSNTNRNINIIVLSCPVYYYHKFNTVSSTILQQQGTVIEERERNLRQANNKITQSLDYIDGLLKGLNVEQIIERMNKANTEEDFPYTDITEFNTKIATIEGYKTIIDENLPFIIVNANKAFYQNKLNELLQTQTNYETLIEEQSSINTDRIEKLKKRNTYLKGEKEKHEGILKQLEDNAIAKGVTLKNEWFGDYKKNYKMQDLSNNIISKQDSIDLYNDEVKSNSTLQQLDNSLNDINLVYEQVKEYHITADVDKNIIQGQVNDLSLNNSILKDNLGKINIKDETLKGNINDIKDRLKIKELNVIMDHNNLDLKHINDTVNHTNYSVKNVSKLLQDQQNKTNYLTTVNDKSKDVIFGQEKLIEDNIKEQETYQIEEFTNLNKYNMKYMDPKYQDYRLSQEECNSRLLVDDFVCLIDERNSKVCLLYTSPSPRD